MFSIPERLAASAVRKVKRATKYVAKKTFLTSASRTNVRQKGVRYVLKSSFATNVYNTVLRSLVSELLLMLLVAATTPCIVIKLHEPAAAGATSETVLVFADRIRHVFIRLYNYASPCVLSGLITVCCRDPIARWCETYTRPAADHVAKQLAANWFNDVAWFVVKYALLIALGAVVVAISQLFDAWTAATLVSQTVLTNLALGLSREPDHPLRRILCRQHLRDQQSQRRHGAQHFSATTQHLPRAPAFAPRVVRAHSQVPHHHNNMNHSHSLPSQVVPPPSCPKSSSAKSSARLRGLTTSADQL